ncbi:hypothetical protein IM543_20050 [Massilia sp. UMI-21]|nr:hypothetical protein IM543_20050 [Massilia sp. UMI-21]
MNSLLRQACVLAACLALSFPAAAADAPVDSEIPLHADRFVRALQQQRFDAAAAMFATGERDAPAATAAQLKRTATRIGGYATMRNVLSLPSGSTLKYTIPSGAALAPRPPRYHQVAYMATAADGQPVFYVLALGAGAPAPGVLWFEVHLPTPDPAARKRAEQALGDIM